MSSYSNFDTKCLEWSSTENTRQCLGSLNSTCTAISVVTLESAYDRLFVPVKPL